MSVDEGFVLRTSGASQKLVTDPEAPVRLFDIAVMNHQDAGYFLEYDVTVNLVLILRIARNHGFTSFKETL